MGSVAIRSRWSALALLVLSVACARTPAPTATTGEWLALDGSGTAAGTRTTLDPGSDRRSSILHLKDSFLLNGNNRVGVGFRAAVINFSASATGMSQSRRTLIKQVITFALAIGIATPVPAVVGTPWLMFVTR